MIRINLLPVREARRKANLNQQLFAFALTVGITIGAAWLFHVGILRKISVMEERVTELAQKIEEYKPEQARVEQFKKKKAEIRAKLDVIDELERSRSGPVRMLDELAIHIPERVWLTELEARNGEIEINGLSLDNELIALLLTALSNSPYFLNVELEGTELKQVEALKLNSFRIRASLQNPEAQRGETRLEGARSAASAG